MKRRLFVVGLMAAYSLSWITGCEASKPPMQTQASRSTAADNVAEIPSTPAEREVALKLLEKSIIAHGGGAAMAKMRVSVRKMKGTINLPNGFQTTADQELKIQYPGRIRLASKIASPLGTKTITQAMRENHGWYADNTDKVNMQPETVRDVQGELYLRQVLNLLPLRADPAALRPIDGEPVEGRSTLGIRVTHKTWPAVNLYFDAESFLLVKSAGLFREAGREYMREMTFSDFKSFDGLKLPAHMYETQDGARFQDCSIEYSFPSTIPDKEFEEP